MGWAGSGLTARFLPLFTLKWGTKAETELSLDWCTVAWGQTVSSLVTFFSSGTSYLRCIYFFHVIRLNFTVQKTDSRTISAITTALPMSGLPSQWEERLEDWKEEACYGSLQDKVPSFSLHRSHVPSKEGQLENIWIIY